MTKVFLHACCAPCASGCVPALLAQGYEVTGYFYNPNIQPFTEHKARMLTFCQYMEDQNLPYYLNAAYPLADWLRQALENWEHRCRYCYQNRLQATAALAKQLGYDAFTTTLLISPYQDREAILEIGEKVAQQFAIPFLPEDFRPHFRSSQLAAKESGMYMQKYCGCIFSEQERYQKLKAPGMK